jgi:hypothetical protein
MRSSIEACEPHTPVPAASLASIGYLLSALAIVIRPLLLQSARGSAAARANVQSRTRSSSIPTRSAKRRMVPSASDRRLAEQLKRCWVRSKAGSPTNGFGSITSHGWRCARNTFPACRSVASKTFSEAVRGSSAKRRSPSRTSPASGHSSVWSIVSAVQYSIKADKGRNGCGALGVRHRRCRRLAMTIFCSDSGRSRKEVPGSQRSRSMAPISSSDISSRTVGSPFQERKPGASSRPSICGRLSFSTAGESSVHVTDATHEQLELPYTVPIVNDHCFERDSTVAGNRSSHVAHVGSWRQVAARRSGIFSAMRPFASQARRHSKKWYFQEPRSTNKPCI